MHNTVGRFSSNCRPIWLYTAVPSSPPFPNVIPVALQHRLVSGLYSSLLAQFFLSSFFTPLTKHTYILVFLPFALNAQTFPILFSYDCFFKIHLILISFHFQYTHIIITEFKIETARTQRVLRCQVLESL